MISVDQAVHQRLMETAPARIGVTARDIAGAVAACLIGTIGAPAAAEFFRVMADEIEEQ